MVFLINRIIISITIMLFLPSISLADGNQVLEECQNVERYLDAQTLDNSIDVGMCLGLIEGVRNTMFYLNEALPEKLKTCFPEKDITNGQATRIVVDYLRNNPAYLHKDGTLLIMLAYRNAYPCK